MARSHAELAAALEQARQRLAGGGQSRGDHRKIAFLFAGSGSQHPGMAAALYQQFPAFTEQIDECDRLFRPYLGLSIADLMLGRVADSAIIHEIRYAQPAMFTLEYALANLWIHWGARPNVLIGHSTGEIAAATVAGVFSLADGVRITEARSRLMHEVTAPGGMAAVSAPASEIAQLVEQFADLGIAAINSPGQCVISGGVASLDTATELLRSHGYKVTRLAISIAAHSPLMSATLEEFREMLRTVQFREPRLTVISNVTGTVAGPDMGSVDYWLEHLQRPVNFAAGMQAIEKRGKHVFIEIGPSTTLTSLATQCVSAADPRWIVSLHPEDVDGAMIRQAVADLYTAGLNPSWARLYADSDHHQVALPTYAFDRQRYWLPRGDTADSVFGAHVHLPPVAVAACQ